MGTIKRVIFTTYIFQAIYCQGPLLVLFSFEGDTLITSENGDLSFTFWPNIAANNQFQGIYRMEVQTRTSDNNYEYDGRVVRWNNTCIVTYENSVRCLSDNGPAKLSRRVNRSHLEIVWTCSWKDSDSQSLRNIERRFNLKMSHGCVSLFSTPVMAGFLIVLLAFAFICLLIIANRIRSTKMRTLNTNSYISMKTIGNFSSKLKRKKVSNACTFEVQTSFEKKSDEAKDQSKEDNASDEDYNLNSQSTWDNVKLRLQNPVIGEKTLAEVFPVDADSDIDIR
ncbi:uncharacterized protein LOC112568055 [Pomacea canaliculata]|uniref:uncharacterized protein LOC112568055 n=1 Tax=Pomacea canaliculata TaxID=400727 RepID=UPI000D73E18F|nr:uncharacterized protein LOC112568055 [Pomacea canaliculata]